MSTETAAEVIRQSYILGHILDPNEVPSGYYMTLGIMYFNQILEELGACAEYIPYYTKTVIPILQNTITYQVTPVIAQFLEANIVDAANISYPIRQATDAQYNLFNFSFPANRPQIVYISKEQTFDNSGNLASNIIVYPNPNANYTLNLLLKYKLPPISQLTLDQELLFLPPHWIKPVRYMVANDLINQFGTKVNPSFYKDLEDSKELLKANNPQDMCIQTDNPFVSIYPFQPRFYSYVG